MGFEPGKMMACFPAIGYQRAVLLFQMIHAKARA
jgi:hypothetical protein